MLYQIQKFTLCKARCITVLSFRFILDPVGTGRKDKTKPDLRIDPVSLHTPVSSGQINRTALILCCLHIFYIRAGTSGGRFRILLFCVFLSGICLCAEPNLRFRVITETVCPERMIGFSEAERKSLAGFILIFRAHPGIVRIQPGFQDAGFFRGYMDAAERGGTGQPVSGKFYTSNDKMKSK